MSRPPHDPTEIRKALVRGDWEQARVLLEAALEADPGDGRNWGLLALARRNLGQPEQALSAAREATRLAPQLTAAWLEQAEAALGCSDGQQARSALARAAALGLRDGDRLRVARLWLKLGDPAAAVPLLRTYLRGHDQDASAWRLLLASLERSGTDPDALRQASQQAALTGGGMVDWMRHAHVCFAADRFAEGHDALQGVIALAPSFLPARWAAFQYPGSPTPDSDAAADAFRSRWAAGVAEFAALDPQDPEVAQHVAGCLGQCTAYFRHYLDEAIEAQHDYGRLLAQLVAAAGPRQRTQRDAPRAGRRRVGYLTSHLRDHTVDRLFGPLVAGLDPQRFEVHVLALDGAAPGHRQRHQDAGQTVHDQPREITAWAHRIAELDFDVLLFAEVGMDPSAQYLAALRLAPVQAVLWGHPVTTGLDSIDYVLGSDLFEPPDGDRHYVEQLVRLPGLGAALSPPADVIRRAAGERGTGVQLFCAQSVYKILPRMDRLFARILSAVPGSRLHLIAHPRAHVREQLRQRMAPVLVEHGVEPDRVELHPLLPHAGFMQLAADCDLGLDTIGWSGGMSTIDCFAAGLPIVAHEGRVMRQRQTAALARWLGADELVAFDEADYVERAIALAGDREARERLSATIQDRIAALFDHAPALAALERFLATAEAQPRS